MKLTERDRRVIKVGGAAVAAIVLMRMAVLPWVDGWSEARERTWENRRVLEGLEGKLARALRQRETLGGRYGPGVKEPWRGSQGAQVALLEAAQVALKGNGFEGANYTPHSGGGREMRELPGAQMEKLQVQGQCDEAALGRCLAALRGGRTLIVVETLSMSGDPKKPGKLDVTMLLATPAGLEEKDKR